MLILLVCINNFGNLKNSISDQGTDNCCDDQKDKQISKLNILSAHSQGRTGSTGCKSGHCQSQPYEDLQTYAQTTVHILTLLW